MAKGGLSEKEAALIAEARAALARKSAARAPEHPAQPAAPSVAAPRPAPVPQAAPAQQPAAPGASASGAGTAGTEPFRATRPDPAAMAARIASLMQAERDATLRRKQKMKQTGTAIVVIAFVPVILWAAAKLISQLYR